MLNVVIFGAPGSVKGTQSELIIKEYGLDHISTGDVLRGEMKAESLEEDVERAWNRRFRYVEPSSRGRGVDQAFIGAR